MVLLDHFNLLISKIYILKYINNYFIIFLNISNARYITNVIRVDNKFYPWFKRNNLKSYIASEMPPYSSVLITTPLFSVPSQSLTLN